MKLLEMGDHNGKKFLIFGKLRDTDFVMQSLEIEIKTSGCKHRNLYL
ncbi:MAG: hypothetical protein KDK36_08150 [Leptospiraceae bacterium]|nr:hypothetical protein [Leptospiraceae bacterium]